MIKQLQPKVNADPGEAFQTLTLGRPENHEVKDLHIREIQEDMYDFECWCRGNERNDKGMPITHNGNLTAERD